MNRKEFAGLRTLTRLALRRDRISAPAWVLALALIVIATVRAFTGLYPTVAERLKFAATIQSNPSLSALTGRIFDGETIGGLTAWRVTVLLSTLLGIVNLLTVVRHTRAEEEVGRAELVLAAPVGRFASLGSALIIAIGIDLALAALITVGMGASGQRWSAGLLLGLAIGSCGACFAGVAVAASQLSTGARTARAIGGGVIAASFLARAVADSSPSASWLSWASPIGWAERSAPFAAQHWWALALPVAAALSTCSVALWIQSWRDIGDGLFRPTAGPPVAAPYLRTPEALAWRLHRASLFGWIFGCTVFGALFGSIADGIASLFDGSSKLRNIITRIGGKGAVIDAFMSGILGMIAFVAAAAFIQAALRMRNEEAEGRLEPLLSTGMSRVRWMVGHLAFGYASAIIAITMAGLAMGLTHGIHAHDISGQVPRLAIAALAHVPAALLVGSVVALVFGAKPALSSVGWGFLVFSLVLAQLGRALNLPNIVVDLSPFTHSPNLPGSSGRLLPDLVLAGLAIAVAAIGTTAFRHRDLGG